MARKLYYTQRKKVTFFLRWRKTHLNEKLVVRLEKLLFDSVKDKFKFHFGFIPPFSCLKDSNVSHKFCFK